MSLSRAAMTAGGDKDPERRVAGAGGVGLPAPMLRRKRVTNTHAMRVGRGERDCCAALVLGVGTCTCGQSLAPEAWVSLAVGSDATKKKGDIHDCCAALVLGVGTCGQPLAPEAWVSLAVGSNATKKKGDIHDCCAALVLGVGTCGQPLAPEAWVSLAVG